MRVDSLPSGVLRRLQQFLQVREIRNAVALVRYFVLRVVLRRNRVFSRREQKHLGRRTFEHNYGALRHSVTTVDRMHHLLRPVTAIASVATNLPTLKTAVFDATAIAEVLQERYDFDDGAIKLLTNATRRDILKALSNFRKNLTTEDRLMLYYAGHGQIDPATDEGFWQPIDAEPENDFTWISNADVKRYLGGIPAKHVLVIADSCFSGSLTRGAETQNDAEDKFFLNIDKYPSRKVIASGGTEPVADAGSEGHSVFAYYLIRTLTNNKKPYITSYQLFEKLVRAVTNNSSQTPEYGTVPNTGDQGAGDFTFILRKGSSG